VAIPPVPRFLSIRGVLRFLGSCSVLFLVLAVTAAEAAEWHVTTGGRPAGLGTVESPWDLASTLEGKRGVGPGDTVWIAGGTYRHPNRTFGAMGYEVRLAGTADQPVQIRARRGQRATIDGGLNVQPPSTGLWLRDLEIIVSENQTRSRRLEETGSSPQSYGRPWGGLNVYTGSDCRFINLVIHDNAQGVSWWAGSTGSELYGCIIYNNGWEAPDRGHGHAIYTQNKDGVKTISDCIMTGGYGYTLHAYGSSRADVDNYLVTGNIAYDGGPFLIGGGKPSRHIRVLTNVLHAVSMQLGYNAPSNEDCEVLGNLIVDGGLAINRYQTAVTKGNLVLPKDAPRPRGDRVILRPNRYDPDRANLAVLNWESKANLRVEPGDFLDPGRTFRLLSPTNFYGQPVLSGVFDGKAITVPLRGEFAAFILMKD
jgi:Right handed beta helix region